MHSQSSTASLRLAGSCLSVGWLLLLGACAANPGAPAGSDASGAANAASDEGKPGRVSKLTLAKLQLEIAQASTEGELAQAALEITLAERGVAEAERDLQHFAQERAVELDDARLDLDRAAGRADDSRLELVELEEMYAEEDFAEKTKELVLNRGRRALEHAMRGLELERRRLNALEEHDLPQRERELEAKLLRSRGVLEQAQRDLEVTRLESQLALLEAQEDVAEAASEDDA